VARPTKFDPIRTQRLLEAVERGLSYNLACQLAGISVSALGAWRRRYGDFNEQLKEAEGRRADRWLGFIEAAAPKNWSAAAWLLERCHPAEYGRHLLGAPEQRYDEATLRALALERGLDPDAFVEAINRVQQAAEASRSQGPSKTAPIPLHARGTRFGAAPPRAGGVT